MQKANPSSPKLLVLPGHLQSWDVGVTNGQAGIIPLGETAHLNHQHEAQGKCPNTTSLFQQMFIEPLLSVWHCSGFVTVTVNKAYFPELLSERQAVENKEHKLVIKTVITALTTKQEKKCDGVTGVRKGQDGSI